MATTKKAAYAAGISIAIKQRRQPQSCGLRKSPI